MTPETLKVNWNHTFKRSSRDNQRTDRIEKDKPKKGFAVRKCPECKQAWEKLNTYNHKAKAWTFIANFPLYGLESKLCPQHDNEQDSNKSS